MGFGMFTAQQTPIAIDFGSSSVKLMQLDRSDPPKLLAAAELAIPETVRTTPQHALAHVATELPALLKSAGFKGKKAVTAIPSGLTHIQHMQIQEMNGVRLEEIAKGQLEMQMNCTPNSLVVRAIPVPGAKCRDKSRTEVICFAASRNVVMQYVQLLNQCKLDVSGMHTESLSAMWAFSHLGGGAGDQGVPTMYLNMGWKGTILTICHGTKTVFSRYIHVGGHHFDQQLAAATKCQLHEAAVQRQSLEQPLARPTAGAPATAPTADGGTVATATERKSGQAADLIPVPMCAMATAIIDRYNFADLIDTVVDEISMCLRYHRGLYPDLPIARTIFVGGDARQPWLTRSIADHLTMDAYVGDPLRRYADTKRFTPGLNLEEPHPGWVVACGLCHAPNDQ